MSSEAIKRSIEYERGYQEGHRDGYAKALNILAGMEEKRTSPSPLAICLNCGRKLLKGRE